MKVCLINGNDHHGSTWNLAHAVVDYLPHLELKEFFLPRDFNQFCLGCMTCLSKTPNACPHLSAIAPLRDAMLEADLIVLTSPVYVFHLSGQMKAFLDHFPWAWIVHGPHPAMFHKLGLVVSSSAGSPVTGAQKEMADSLTMWGIGKIFRFGEPLWAPDWNTVKEEKKTSLLKKAKKLADRITKACHQPKRPSLKVSFWFWTSHFMQKNFHFNPTDVAHWRKMGWLNRKTPWQESNPVQDMSIYPSKAAETEKG